METGFFFFLHLHKDSDGHMTRSPELAAPKRKMFYSSVLLCASLGFSQDQILRQGNWKYGFYFAENRTENAATEAVLREGCRTGSHQGCHVLFIFTNHVIAIGFVGVLLLF